jgi:acetylornithine/succinyldiaminopimelate/putrescine aminotransferase
MIAFNSSYHGSTQGALSAMGSEYFRNAYRPLLPEVYHYDYGSETAVKAIDERVACVLVEPVQAESGITKPPEGWLKMLRAACDKHGSLLIFDEIQAGFGRTGSLWAFEQTGVVPDILLLGKALGGGMPLGAFIADYKLMQTLTHNPVLGHITTFGGHPVSCAAGKAALEVLLETACIENIKTKEQMLLQYLQHPAILSVKSTGLWASLRFKDFETNLAVIHRCITNGLITDWFLFSPECTRIAPPLIITKPELTKACEIILQSIKGVTNI